VTAREVTTPLGPARVHRDDPAGPVVGTMALGHGAGGGVDSADLTAVAAAASGAGWRVLRVEQPWRVAGRRIAPAPPRLDEGWTAVLHALRKDWLAGPLVLGGRSAGARVACRTASAEGAAGVLALAFPLHPPGRPEKSRADELPDSVPTLVLNGDRDPFGVPLPGPRREVAVRPGATHDLRKDVKGTAALAVEWLRRHGWAA
jgi:predicted alpha/beta-hydrolase family hydrolase